MTIASVGTLGSVGSASANQASVVLTLSAQADVGNHIILAIAVDNNTATTNTDEGAVTGIVDNASGGSNTWVKCGEISNSAGAAAQTGATVSIWKCSPVARAIASAGTITVSFNNQNSRDASAVSAWEFSANADSSLKTFGPASSVTNAGDPPSLNLTTANNSMLRFRAIASETNSTTALTVTTNWNAIDGNRSGSGSAAANVTIRGEFRIVSGTSAASDPTYVAADCASVYVAFQEEFRCVCAQGSYLLTGQDVALKHDSKGVEAFGPYVLTGQTVALVRNRPIAAAQGAYALTGQIALLKPTRAVVAVAGSYAIVGGDVQLRTLPDEHLGVAGNVVAGAPVAGATFPEPALGTTITANQGAYALTGQTATLKKISTIPLVAGAYVLSGQAAGIGVGITEPLVGGAYVVSGQTALLVRGHPMVASVGTYTLAGQPAAIGNVRTLMANQGSYVLSGQTALLEGAFPIGVAAWVVAGAPVAGSAFPSQTAAASTYTIPAFFGAYAISGQVVLGHIGRSLAISTGFYFYDGANSVLDYAVRAVQGSYSLSGQVVGLTKGGAILFPLEGGTYTLEGQTASLTRVHQFPMESGLYDYNGDDVTFGFARAHATGFYEVAGQNVLFAIGGTSFTIPAAFGAYVVTGQPVAGKHTYATLGSFGAYTLTGFAVLLPHLSQIDLEFGTYVVTGQLAVFQGAHSIAAQPRGLYQLTGQIAALKKLSQLPMAFGSYVVSGQPAGFEWSGAPVGGVGVNLNRPMLQSVGRLMAA